MSELYESMGFISNPFSRFSAEEELEYLPSIFIKPRYFDVLSDDLLSGNSRFIVGDRGSGKSALMYSLKEKLKQKHSFTLIIDSYHAIPIHDNGTQLLKLIIENLITDFSLILMIDRKKTKCLSKNNKEILSMLISAFYKPLNFNEIERRIDRLTNYKKWNVLKRIVNKLFNKTFNTVLSGTAELISDVIAKSLGLPKTNNDRFYREYIPDFKETTINDFSRLNIETLNYYNSTRILIALRDIILETGYTNITIFFDKIDEFTQLEGKITKISDFLIDIATDTSLLQLDKMSFVFVIWSRVKNQLSFRNVRFDKFKPIDVNWTSEDMELILDQRVKFFSTGKKVPKNVFDSISLGTIINLSNGSPRDLLTLISYIYDEQSIQNPSVTSFSKHAIESGTQLFVIKYDYNSYYGSSDIANSVKTAINRILQVGKPSFLLRDIAEVFKRSQASASNYSRNMKEYGLIKENESSTEQAKEYYVVDPKIKFLIMNGVKRIS